MCEHQVPCDCPEYLYRLSMSELLNLGFEVSKKKLEGHKKWKRTINRVLKENFGLKIL